MLGPRKEFRSRSTSTTASEKKTRICLRAGLGAAAAVAGVVVMLA